MVAKNNETAYLPLTRSDCPDISLPATYFPNQTKNKPNILKYFGGGGGAPQSEDCLTLNIWSKATGAQKKGVLVWLHGGRFTLGNTNTPFYTGQYIADAQDVIMVSVNYRMNIFGFSAAPGVAPNAGLLDQRKAVEWVRDNIAGFGGDPERITIFGQSAGGSAVDYFAYAYPDNPIVAGLISHSGTAFSFAPNTPEYSETTFMQAASMLGCNDSSTVVACMRKKDFKELLAVTPKAKPLPTIAINQAAFHPTVDNKTVFSLDDYTSMAAAGKFAKIPYLAGNNNYEAGFYKIAAYGQKKELSPSQWDTWNLEGFTCATDHATTARANAGVPVYRYRYFAEWPNLVLYPGSGAYHGSDLHMVFGAAEDVTGEPNTIEEIWTTDYTQWAWASFARDPANGLSKTLVWPTYDPKGKRLVSLSTFQESR